MSGSVRPLVELADGTFATAGEWSTPDGAREFVSSLVAAGLPVKPCAIVPDLGGTVEDVAATLGASVG